MRDSVYVSFIIPAFNEESVIGKTITAIHEHQPNKPYEVIVIDNGSTDRTMEIASDSGCLVFSLPNQTITATKSLTAIMN
jgi:glycosyltransferase involved in cell wall biosynthesis